jgi:hypothetical protein
MIYALRPNPASLKMTITRCYGDPASSSEKHLFTRGKRAPADATASPDSQASGSCVTWVSPSQQVTSTQATVDSRS